MKFTRIFLLLFVITTQNAFAQDLSKDRTIGEDGLAQVKDQFGIYTFESLDTLLQKIGARLVAQIEKPLFAYEFYLVDMPEPNAFALPGGKIFVTRGLLMLPLTEDELAGVIGHEIIHSQNRHSIKQQRNTVWGALVALPGLLASGILPGPVGQAVATPFLAGGDLLVAQYSQGHEKEADKEGIALTAKAGYNPQELAVILQRLNLVAELLTGEKETDSYFSTHPYTPKRIAAIKKESAKLPVPEIESQHKEAVFLPLFSGLLTSPNPVNGFIADGSFYHPQKLYSLQVTEEWETEITRKAFSVKSKEEDAIATIQVEKDSLSFGKFLDKFEESMLKSANLKPTKKEKLEWFGYQGGMLEFETNAQGEKVIFQLFAIKYRDGQLLKMAALYKVDSEKKVRLLFKNAKAIEKSDVPQAEVNKLNIVTAQENETLQEIINRLGASEFEKLIAIINDQPLTHVFKAGDLVKIIQRQSVQF